MPELKDLRNRGLVWQIHLLQKRQCVILEGCRVIGHLKRENVWRSTYSADLAGLEWCLSLHLKFLKSILQIDFADGTKGLARAIRSGVGYEAVVDGVAAYRFERSESLRGAWRNQDGYVAVSVAAAETNRCVPT